MEDLIGKLQDLNSLNPLVNYSIQILPSGRFVLHVESELGWRRIDCLDSQDLREKMYRIVLKERNGTKKI